MTLVELMVVLAIFAVVTSLTIFDYGSFRTSVSMQNITNWMRSEDKERLH